MIHQTSAPCAGRQLTDRALRNLTDQFQRFKHTPSDDMRRALREICETLEDMANGNARRRLFLSSLDPGVGKTLALTSFVNVLLNSDRHTDAGVLVCAARLTEIERFAERFPESELAVLTSDKDINSLGKAEPHSARVLVTTQQRLDKVLVGRSFNDYAPLFYNDQPRQVRVWDESYLPGETVTIKRDDIARLFRPIRELFPHVAADLEALFTDVCDVAHGQTYTVPDLNATHGDVNNVLSIFDDPANEADRRRKDGERSTLSLLWFLSGKVVTIRRDGTHCTALDYRDTLPADLAPMLILDASGRLRDTYKDLEHSRGILRPLHPAPKRYDALTVHCWSTSGSKTGWRKRRDRLAKGIARTIDQRPDEQWLIVGHKPSSKVGNIERLIRRRAKARPENLSFIHWGRHMATNEFTEHPNVILAGTLFYPLAHYESLKRLAAGRTSADGPVSKREMRSVERGEHMHLILQALCRGRVRKCNGAKCQPMNAYIISSARSGIRQSLPTIFPGCCVKDWSPLKRKPQGHVRAALDVIDEWLKETADCPDARLPFARVAKGIGIKPHAFKHDVRNHPVFRDELASRGLEECGGRCYFTAFRRIIAA